MPQTLTVAVCICNEVTFSDFIPPMEILSYLNFGQDANSLLAAEVGDVPYHFQIEYLAPTLAPVASMAPASSLPTVNPTNTYGAAMQSGKQYDVIWVPAGNSRLLYDLNIMDSDPIDPPSL